MHQQQGLSLCTLAGRPAPDCFSWHGICCLAASTGLEPSSSVAWHAAQCMFVSIYMGVHQLYHALYHFSSLCSRAARYYAHCSAMFLETHCSLLSMASPFQYSPCCCKMLTAEHVAGAMAFSTLFLDYGGTPIGLMNLMMLESSWTSAMLLPHSVWTLSP